MILKIQTSYKLTVNKLKNMSLKKTKHVKHKYIVEFG